MHVGMSVASATPEYHRIVYVVTMHLAAFTHRWQKTKLSADILTCVAGRTAATDEDSDFDPDEASSTSSPRRPLQNQAAGSTESPERPVSPQKAEAKAAFRRPASPDPVPAAAPVQAPSSPEKPASPERPEPHARTQAAVALQPDASHSSSRTVPQTGDTGISGSQEPAEAVEPSANQEGHGAAHVAESSAGDMIVEGVVDLIYRCVSSRLLIYPADRLRTFAPSLACYHQYFKGQRKGGRCNLAKLSWRKV